MTKADIVRAFVLSRVGCAYIYGCTGRDCTTRERIARSSQYPNYAGKIRENCQRLYKGKSTCAGCKWYGDDAPRPAYDCAQLTRRGAEAAGLALPSGASSQWKERGLADGLHSGWAETGVLAGMPRDKVCVVFRRTDSANPMGHVGWYLGDGTCVDARGHERGVVKSLLSEYPWTHYAILKGLYAETVPEQAAPDNEPRAGALARAREAYAALEALIALLSDSRENANAL